MEYLISASQGAMRSLPGKIESLLLEPENGLRKGEKDEIGRLKSDLREIIDSYLMEPSEVETPAFTANCWVKEVRELSYDIDDFIDKLVHDDADARIVARLRKKLNPRRRWITDEISGFRTRVKEVIQRHRSYNLDKITFRPRYVPDEHPIRPLYGEGAAGLVDIDIPMNKLEEWLIGDVEQNLRVVSIVGFGGVGKTTLAKELYCKLGGRFECRAFVRTSRKPDVRKLLTSILSQLRVHLPPDARAWGLDELIKKISTHLQSKRYFIIVDDIWTASIWDIVSGALPEGSFCSRILTTTEIEAAAQTCCGYNPKYILKMEPLSDDASRKLFCSRVFGHQHERSKQLTEASYEIARKCGGFPLAIITTASLLASHLDRLEQCNYIKNSLSSNLRTDPTLEGMTQVLNVSYNNLPQHLRTCMLYFSIYQEDYIIWKDDLVKQWIAEGFISAIEGKDMEEVAMSYFGELVNRGLIQPVDVNYNDEVLSCTVHYMVLDLIQDKCVEENFVTTIHHSHTTVRHADKIRRLSLHFGNEDVTPPASLRLSQVRSLAYFGLYNCMPSITGFKLLRVLILHLWGDQDNMILDLNTINKLFRLRYLEIACNVTLEIQTKMHGLQYLETIKIDARVSAVEVDIVNLPGLLHLTLPSEINPPIGIDHMTLLRTLGRFNLSSNSVGNVESLGKLTNLRNLHLTCSTASSDNLDKNMKCLGSVLEKLSNLTSITLVPAGFSHVTLDYAGASGTSISHDGLNSISTHLERLELSRRICTFSNLHGWIGKLNKLCILKTAVRELLRNDIDILKGLPALTALSLYVQTAPVERIVFDKEGFSVLKYFKFKCRVPWLKFEAGAMPNLRKLMLGFNALGADQHGTAPINIEHLPGLKEISAKIGGAGSDVDSALAIAVSSHPRNPRVNVQGTREKQYGTLEEQDEILEEDPDKHYGSQDGESGEDENKQAGSMARREQEHGTLVHQDKIMEDYPDKDSGEDENKQTGRRISTSPESSSHLPIPGSDVDSALAITVSSHPRNPSLDVQGRRMVTKEKQYGTLVEQDEILQEDPDRHYGSRDGESGEDENKQAGSMARQEQEHWTLVDQDEIMEDDPDEDSGEDENKQTGRRISTLPESSSHLPVPELMKDESLFGNMAEMVRKGGMEALPGAVQMVTGDGTYRAADVERFIGSCKELSAPRTPYTVVSILGAQSSGKSFLLNCLFGTDFGVMDGAKGRRKTTKGIWLAKCIHPSFLVMDVEGSDGRERGEDDTSFEKQSALFALVVSDLILVNMWLHDIGRLQGGNIPLLKLIFKESTKLEPHKTRMVIVIRDYDYETPEEILKKDVVATLNEIWRSVACGNIQKLSDYISLSVMIFPPKREELKFEERCAVLREWLATGSLAGLRQNKVPAFGFSFSAESIWETVRQNEQLNLPSHNKLVAYMLCSRMKSKKLASLESDENFLKLTGDTPACPKDFLIIMEKLVEPILNDFDAGTEGLDETVADETRKELVLHILQLLEPACEIMLKKLSCAILDGSMKHIINDLKDTDHPTQCVDTVIRPSLDMFDDQCRDLKLKYGTSVAEHRATLASRLDTFAREKARKIEEKGPDQQELLEEGYIDDFAD